MCDLMSQHFEAVRARWGVCAPAEEDVRRTGERACVDSSREHVGLAAGWDPEAPQVSAVRTLEARASYRLDLCSLAARPYDPTCHDVVALHSTCATEHGPNGAVACMALEVEDSRRRCAG